MIGKGNQPVLHHQNRHLVSAVVYLILYWKICQQRQMKPDDDGVACKAALAVVFCMATNLLRSEFIDYFKVFPNGWGGHFVKHHPKSTNTLVSQR